MTLRHSLQGGGEYVTASWFEVGLTAMYNLFAFDIDLKQEGLEG